jgi:TonB family protein
MNGATAEHESDLALFDAGRVRTRQDDRRFIVWLVVVAALHVVCVIGFTSAAPRRLGDPSGADDAISVAIVTEADLLGRATVDDRGPGSVPRPDQPTSASEPQSERAAAVLPPSEIGSVPPRSTSQPMTGTEPAAKAAEAAPELSGPREKTKQGPSKQEKSSESKTRTANLDLTPPPELFTAPFGGGGAGVERPAGITRSGENYAFGRAVIRALQRTMPQLQNTSGRVTVRITLDMNGSLVSTQVVRPSNIPGLDQSVVFATRQTSFPFPPRNAILADLIFTVTYIYH